MKISASDWLGVGLLLFAGLVITGGKFWVDSPTLVAVKTPIPLSRGTIAKVDFTTNLQAYYLIQIYFPVGAPPDRNEENLRSRRLRSIVNFPVHQVGEASRRSDVEVTYRPVLGAFQSEPNQYNLTIENSFRYSML